MESEIILKILLFVNGAIFLIFLYFVLRLVIPIFKEEKKEMESKFYKGGFIDESLRKGYQPTESLDRSNPPGQDNEITSDISSYHKYSLLSELRETQQRSYNVLVFSNKITTEIRKTVFSDPVQKMENRYWYFHIGNTSYKYFDTELEARLALDKFQKENL